MQQQKNIPGAKKSEAFKAITYHITKKDRNKRRNKQNKIIVRKRRFAKYLIRI